MYLCFTADVWIPFESDAIPFTTTTVGDVTLVSNAQVGAGQAASFNGGRIEVEEVTGHECFYDPYTGCTDGFTMSFLLKPEVLSGTLSLQLSPLF